MRAIIIIIIIITTTCNQIENLIQLNEFQYRMLFARDALFELLNFLLNSILLDEVGKCKQFIYGCQLYLILTYKLHRVRKLSRTDEIMLNTVYMIKWLQWRRGLVFVLTAKGDRIYGVSLPLQSFDFRPQRLNSRKWIQICCLQPLQD